MKTAEEWTDELVFSDSNQEQREDFIKQIQLDAWKQGMTDAAKTAHAVFMGYEKRDPKPAILEQRDNKTVL